MAAVLLLPINLLFMKIAVIGATGLVGQRMLTVLEEQNFPADRLIPAASSRSVGSTITFRGEKIEVVGVEAALALKPAIALFSAGAAVSKEMAPRFVADGCYVIDNSSAWRMDPAIPLIVPEVNGHLLDGSQRLIANPNCSTIQLVMVLKPLHDMLHLKRVIVSTYQSVTGTGYQAIQQLNEERTGHPASNPVYPYPIDLNCIPQCDVFVEDGYTKEEMKVVHESRKILGIHDLAITATAVRIPTVGGHSESVNIEFEKEPDMAKIVDVLQSFPGIIVQDHPDEKLYPMPIKARDKNEVFVGRLRKDTSCSHAINCWIVADNLRKGAATNSVQIAQYLLENNLLR